MSLKKFTGLSYVNGVYERASSHLKNYMNYCVSRSKNNLSNVIIKGNDQIKNHIKNNAVYKVDSFSRKYSYTTVRRKVALKNGNLSTITKKTHTTISITYLCTEHTTISIGNE